MRKEIVSHSEKDILSGCIGLMSEVYQRMINYLDFIGVDLNELPEEERPDFYFSYFEIVQELFLMKTTHSGGTSTMEKCMELGVDCGENVEFKHNEYEPDYY
ncbi:MAG: hypothetical protein LUH14_10250 [Clostridiaceae bacterium]|nr:hypothetical protein [Clostridiaceae bacterium]